jgi:hypothetical protein
MKSLANLLEKPAGEPLLADDILELHAARLMLLISVCGTKTKGSGLRRLEGLTKLAKLDFLVRYPDFFKKLAGHLGQDTSTPLREIESSMVRFHYGPWDDRYYHVLAYLESRGLMHVSKDGNTYKFSLTELGGRIADNFADSDVFNEMTEHIRCVRDLVGKKRGNELKNLVYKVFGKEVADLKLGEAIS